jgi:hypothetical protein
MASVHESSWLCQCDENGESQCKQEAELNARPKLKASPLFHPKHKRRSTHTKLSRTSDNAHLCPFQRAGKRMSKYVEAVLMDTFWQRKAAASIFIGKLRHFDAEACFAKTQA